MAKRRIGPFMVEPVGLGAMSLSHAYLPRPSREEAARLLHRALDIGVDLLDTAALYGFGGNETLIGETLAGRRDEFVLASKCGMFGVGGKRVIDGRPETLAANLEDSLKRLRTDRIDVFYLHRRDFAVPIEDSVGALARMVDAGKVRAIGLSEISADTLSRAQAVHPIAAVQNEYSPWSREAEIAVLAKTAEIGAAFVAFSPIARGFLAGSVLARTALAEGDIRRAMPRFSEANLPRNLLLLEGFLALAGANRIAPAQLAIAWGLAKSPQLISIPGTGSIAHLEENFAARAMMLANDVVDAVDRLVNNATVAGQRYPDVTLDEIDTEAFGL